MKRSIDSTRSTRRMRCVLGYASLLLATDFAQAAPPSVIHTQAELVERLEAAVTCKGAAVDSRDKGMTSSLKRLGVKVTGDEEGTIDLTYQLPKGMTLFGFPAKTVSYQGDSGSVFYVLLAADLDTLRKKFSLIPVPKAHEDYGWGLGSYYRNSVQPTKDNPYPSLVFAGKPGDAPPGYVALGCQEFDY